MPTNREWLDALRVTVDAAQRACVPAADPARLTAMQKATVPAAAPRDLDGVQHLLFAALPAQATGHLERVTPASAVAAALKILAALQLLRAQRAPANQLLLLLENNRQVLGALGAGARALGGPAAAAGLALEGALAMAGQRTPIRKVDAVLAALDAVIAAAEALTPVVDDACEIPDET